MNCECLYMLKPEQQTAENYLNLGKALGTEDVERYPLSLAVIEKPVYVYADVNYAAEEPDYAALELPPGNLVLFVGGKLKYMKPFHCTGKDPAVVMFPAYSAEGFFKEIYTFPDNLEDFGIDAVKSNITVPKGPSRTEEDDEEDIYAILKDIYYGEALEELSMNPAEIKFEYSALNDDRDFVFEAVRNNPETFMYISDEHRSDREICIAAVSQCGYYLESATDELRADREVVLEAVTSDGYAISYASEDLQNDPEISALAARQVFKSSSDGSLPCGCEDLMRIRGFVLACMDYRWDDSASFFYLVPEEFKSDREIMLKAVRQFGENLDYAADELKGDREIIFEAVKENGWAINYASCEFLNDREIMETAVRQMVEDDRYWCDLSMVNDFVLKSREYVRAVLKYSDLDLWDLFHNGEDIPKEFSSDRDLMLVAVQKNGHNIRYASGNLKRDEEIIAAAIKDFVEYEEYYGLCDFVHDNKDFLNSREFLLAAIKVDRIILNEAPDCFKEDREIILAAAKTPMRDDEDFIVLEVAGERFKNDREIVLEAVKNCGRELYYAAKEFRSDREIMLEAVRGYGYVIEVASEDIQHDPEIVKEAVEQMLDDGILDDFIDGNEGMLSNRVFVLECVRHDGTILEIVPDELKNDREIVTEAARQNKDALQYAARELFEDKDFMKMLNENQH